MAMIAGLVCVSAPALAQNSSVFVEQATEAEASTSSADAKVYFPNETDAPRNARQPAQLSPVDQAGNQIADNAPVDQVAGTLPASDSARALAQLSDAERQVLLDAVDGTDICERGAAIAAIEALCKERIENRSAEFARRDEDGLAEDRLLGGGLDGRRVATLESAITRLARGTGDVSNPSNQAIASVALSNNAPADGQEAVDQDPTSDLSPQTQALVAAIIQNLGGN